MAATKTRISKRQKDKFLEVLTTTGNIGTSCKAAGINHYSTVYGIRNRDAKFRRRWQDILDDRNIQRVEHAEDAVYRRGVEGYLRPVYYKGRVVGHERVYSDANLARFLAAEKPSKWSDRHRMEHSGEISGPQSTLVILPILEDEKA